MCVSLSCQFPGILTGFSVGSGSGSLGQQLRRGFDMFVSASDQNVLIMQNILEVF